MIKHASHVRLGSMQRRYMHWSQRIVSRYMCTSVKIVLDDNSACRREGDISTWHSLVVESHENGYEILEGGRLSCTRNQARKDCENNGCWKK